MLKWSLPLFIGLMLVNCTRHKAYEPIPLDCSIEPSYNSDIAPLIEAKCATGTGPGTGCHDAWILNYEGLKARVERGDIKEVIYDERSMPPIPNSFSIPDLTEEERNQILCWIYAGAPEN